MWLVLVTLLSPVILVVTWLALAAVLLVPHGHYDSSIFVWFKVVPAEA